MRNTKKTSEVWDVVVIGAGPIGIATAVSCQNEGLKVLLIDRGGLCEAMRQFPTNMTFFSTAEKIEFDGVPFACPNPKPTRAEALAYYQRFALHHQIPLQLHTQITGIAGEIGDFRCQSTRGTFRTARVVLATGFYDQPVMLGIPGENLSKCSHHFGEGFDYAGQKLAIVGGANSAVIAALECWRCGADVTLIHRGAQLRESVKYWLRPDFENRVTEGDIQAHFATTIAKVEPQTITVTGPAGEQRLDNDRVLFLTGYRSDFNFLTACGIERNKDEVPLVDPESLESLSRPGVHLVGCVRSGNHTGSVFLEHAKHDATQLGSWLASAGKAAATSP